jgi:DNA excision repair protein ERCC-2
VLYLFDERFARPEVRALLPAWWAVDLCRTDIADPTDGLTRDPGPQ